MHYFYVCGEEVFGLADFSTEAVEAGVDDLLCKSLENTSINPIIHQRQYFQTFIQHGIIIRQRIIYIDLHPKYNSLLNVLIDSIEKANRFLKELAFDDLGKFGELDYVIFVDYNRPDNLVEALAYQA